MKTSRTHVPVLTVFIISASALSYEILLMRLFSIIQWHHFAYMIISLSLLGYGASGTFITITKNYLLKRYHISVICNVLLFSLTSISCFLAAQSIQFNPEEIFWDFRQFPLLVSIYLLLSLPFFFAANCIALSITFYRESISKIYAADLMGAGIGSIGITVLLYVLFPENALKIIAFLGLLAAAVAWLEFHLQPRILALLITCFAFSILLLPKSWMELRVSPYKELPQALRIKGAKVVDKLSSPLGLITVVENKTVPWRYAPGLSLKATVEPPEQLAIFTDNGGMDVINNFNNDTSTFSYLDLQTSALPFHLVQPEKVAVIAAGGGSNVLRTLMYDAKMIDVVELNPQVIKIVKDYYSGYAGNIYKDQRVNLHNTDGRGFLVRSMSLYDLILVPRLNSFGATASGLYALSENYLYTVEALQVYLEKLSPGGILSMDLWLRIPPRDSLKMFATAIDALNASGAKEPGKNLILMRNWQTATLLIKNGEFSRDDINRFLDFTTTRMFDVAYYPGIKEEEANRFNILQQPQIYLGARALLGNEKQSFNNSYKFDLKPATDDRPYFHNFIKWSTVKEIVTLRGSGGLPLLEWGYPVLIATLIQSVLASLILILLPLGFLKNKHNNIPQQISKIRVLVFFFSIGIAFLMLEIAFIQKLVLFLHHPLFAVSTSLFSFLIFAGLGSRASNKFSENWGYNKTIFYAVSGIILFGFIIVSSIGVIIETLAWLPLLVRIILSVFIISPMAFCMGIPFPLAMASIEKPAPELIPWAWAVNGCASVISAVLATIVAIHFGFVIVFVWALVFYGIAYVNFPDRQQVWRKSGYK